MDELAFLEEARRMCPRYVRHDVTAHEDDSLCAMVEDKGMGHYGLYWLLVELLTSRKGHIYDLSDQRGWKRLAYDLSCMTDVSVPKCKAFVKDLYDYGLISTEHFDEGMLAIKRVLRDSESYAQYVAKKKYGAWKTNQKKRDAKQDA